MIGDLEKLGKMHLFCPDSGSALKNEQETVNEIRRKLRTVEKIFIYSDKSIEIYFRFRNEYEQAVQLVGREAISGEVVI